MCAEAVDGRMLLMISTDDAKEPRLQITNTPDTQQVFGVDVNNLRPGEAAVINGSVFGYPVKTLSNIPRKLI